MKRPILLCLLLASGALAQGTGVRPTGEITGGYDHLSGTGTLGGGVSGLFPGYQLNLFPESHFQVWGTAGFVVTNGVGGSAFGLSLDWNDPNAQFAVADSFNTTKRSFSLSPVSRKGALFSSDGRSESRFGLGRMFLEAGAADGAKWSLELGNRVTMDLGPELLHFTGSGMQARFSSPALEVTALGSRINTSFGLGEADRDARFSPSLFDEAAWRQQVSRYVAGVDARFKVNLGRTGDDLLLGLTGLGLFHQYADSSRGAASVLNRLFVRIRSTSVGTSKYPPLLNRSSSVTVRLKSGAGRTWSDFKGDGLWTTPVLWVTSPVLDNGTALGGRNDRNSYNGLGDLYAQPEEVTAGAADYYKSSMTFEIPLDKAGATRISEVASVELKLRLRYNYVVEASFDGFQWEPLIDSRAVNGGYGDIGAFSFSHQSAIADYPMGQDLDRHVTLQVNPAHFSLVESRALGKFRSELHLGPLTVSGSVGVNRTLDLRRGEDLAWSGALGGSYKWGRDLLRVEYRMLGAGWQTRLDGYALRDTTDPASGSPQDRRSRSPLMAAFEAVEDNESRSSLGDDRAQSFVAALRRDLDQGPAFPYSMDRTPFTFIEDRNNNGVPDGEENDHLPDYGIRKGEQQVQLHWTHPHPLGSLSLFASWKRREGGGSRFLGYAWDTARATNLEMFSAPAPGSAEATTVHGVFQGPWHGNDQHQMRHGVAARFSLDALPDHSDLQRFTSESNESQPLIYDALEGYRRMSLQYHFDEDFHIIAGIHLNQSLAAEGRFHVTGSDATSAISNLMPNRADFFWGESWQGALSSVQRSLALYQPGPAVRILPLLDHEVALTRRFPLVPDRKGPAPFMAASASALSHVHWVEGLEERARSDFDLAVGLYVDEEKKKETTQVLRGGLELRGRLTKDWLARGWEDGRGLLVSAHLAYQDRGTEVRAGISYSVLDYHLDGVPGRRNNLGAQLEDLSAVQASVQARVSW